MGKTDSALKVWLSNPERFADLFNAILFEGKHVIDESKLTPIGTEHNIILHSNQKELEYLQKFRDISMLWDDSIALIILACENQDKINYGMPVRNMLYDSMSYSSQIQDISNSVNLTTSNTIPDIYYSKKLNNHKLTPVISLVLYYGDEDWDAPVSVYEMFNINSKNADFIKRYVSNYRINLVVPSKIDDYSQFTSDLQVIFNMLKYRKNKKQLKEFVDDNLNFFKRVPNDTMDVIKILLKTGKRFNDKLISMNEDNKEEVDMCIFDEFYDDGVADGIKQGIEQGIRVLIETLRDDKFSLDMIEKTIAEKFELSEKDANEYMAKYINYTR